MWIRVATNSDSLKTGGFGGMYVEGNHVLEFYFDEQTAALLDGDKFLPEMWNRFDAMFDWGDCDFFGPEKCEKLRIWLAARLNNANLHPDVRNVYATMLDYAELAIRCGTGIYFDF